MATLELTNERKPWTEAEFLEKMGKREWTFAPVDEVRLSENGLSDADSKRVLEVLWRDRTSRFVFRYRPQSTPKSLETTVALVQRDARARRLPPLVIVPYLSEKALQQLKAEDVSGLDLCGNGFVAAPGFSIWQSGTPNRFKEPSAIRNIFLGNSSLLARCFLLQPQYASSNELRAFALERFQGETSENESLLTRGTVSKVVQGLEEERIITRSKKELKLTDADALLERLKSNYRKPKGTRLVGKTPFDLRTVWENLVASSLRAVTTGSGSASCYKVLSGQSRLSLYVDDLQKAQERLKIVPGPLFPNIELIEEKSDLVYFDTRRREEAIWSSPIQTWLELSHSGPRELEAAGQLESIFRCGEGATL